eukprot:403353716
MMRASQKVQQYYSNEKIMTRIQKSKYDLQVPDYMRPLDNPGWITVSPSQNLSRKEPLEKNIDFKHAHKTSDLAPSWMQTTTSQFYKSQGRSSSVVINDKLSQIQYQSVVPKGLRFENYRTFLMEKQVSNVKDQGIASRSVFNLGHTRHNVPFKEMIDNRGASLEPVRLVQWGGETQSEFKMKPITGKI